jgi:hypothetical protein
VGAPRLIFCADGNSGHAGVAVAAGWLYGARLPAKGLAPHPLAFADQDWKRPDRAKYMACLARHRPSLATVLDWEHPEQLPEVFSWAEEAAQYVAEAVLVIPKVPGGVPSIPGRIGGKEVWLAYSVPTSYGGSPLGLWEFAGRPVHLLGGSPQKQREIWSYLRGIADVRSLDNNMVKKMATGRCCYWTRHTTGHGHWQPIARAVEHNAPDECLKRSLVAIGEAWGDWSDAKVS